MAGEMKTYRVIIVNPENGEIWPMADVDKDPISSALAMIDAVTSDATKEYTDKLRIIGVYENINGLPTNALGNTQWCSRDDLFGMLQLMGYVD